SLSPRDVLYSSAIKRRGEISPSSTSAGTSPWMSPIAGDPYSRNVSTWRRRVTTSCPGPALILQEIGYALQGFSTRVSHCFEMPCEQLRFRANTKNLLHVVVQYGRWSITEYSSLRNDSHGVGGWSCFQARFC